MVSDGLETCGGDPVAVARELHEQGLRVTVDIVGFGAGAADTKQLKQIAAAGGGDYFDAKTQADLSDYLLKQMEASTKTVESGNCFAEAFNDANSCDDKFVLAAGEIVNRAVQENADDYFKTHQQDYKLYPAYFKRANAYDELKTRIGEKLKERRESRAGTRKQADELYDKSRDLNKQFQENYDRNK